MSSSLIVSCVLAYSALLFGITWLTTRKSSNASFFNGNKNSKWYVVAYGMIGASLSGVTFMSIPGLVGTSQFSYLMVVFGYLIGYAIIAFVLLPLYHKMNLTSIYGYFESRFGLRAYKTGALFFILSRTIGASFRLFLVVNVLQVFVFDAMGVPFIVTVGCFLILILLYTYEGGIKTIVWTDTLQTTFMLLSVLVTIYLVVKQVAIPFDDILQQLNKGGRTQIIFTDWNDKRSYLKQFISGVFICITMTGMDQEMMQKNLSCKNLRDAQKNMLSFSAVLVVVNFLFLFLGAILYYYTDLMHIQLPEKTDNLFPIIALQHLGIGAGLIFIIGLISAAYPSADGAITSLTTSVCVDLLHFNTSTTELQRKKIRHRIHIGFAVLLLLVVVGFKQLNDTAVIEKLFKAAGYTYGPLLGLFGFGLLTNYRIKDRWSALICITSPIICYIIADHSKEWLGGFDFGFLILPFNGLLTFLGLFLIRSPRKWEANSENVCVA